MPGFILDDNPYFVIKLSLMTQAALPLYIQIAEVLRRSIRDQVYQAGDRLPTEAQLAERFGVNRHTLRQAIALLRQEGLLRVERGRGTFVTAAPIRYAIGKRVRYNEALRAHGHTAEFTLLRALEIPADPSVAKDLALKPGDPVALIERLGSADGQPISVGTGYFPLGLFPDLLSDASLALLQETGSISQWLRQRYDCDHIRRSTCVSARLVKPHDAKLLELPLNQPILLAEAINEDQQGRLIEYGVARFRGDRMELVFEQL